MTKSSTRWTTIKVPDLDCPTELGLIQTGLRPLEGIRQLRPDYLARRLQVEHDANIDADSIVRKMLDIGFSASVADPLGRSPAAETPQDWKSRAWLLLAMVCLVLALGLQVVQASSAAVAVLSCLSAVLAGIPVARNAWCAVRLRQLDMNALLTLASIGAIATGETLEAATGMVLFRISLLIDESSKRKAQRSIRAPMQLSPSVAHRVVARGADQVELHETPVSALQVGQAVRVKPGERIPVDGVVVSGVSSVNEAPITGEPRPVSKQHGDPVYGGALNGEGSIDVRITHSASESTPARITRLIEQAQSAPSPTERFVDRFARVYTPAVISLAIVTALVPPAVHPLDPQSLGSLGEGPLLSVWRIWFYRSLVVLVIACPCALVLSTPITVVCGLFNASRSGILVKGGEFLERVGRATWIALDKTGTLTAGTPRVVGIQPLDEMGTEQLLAHAAALERHSEHPLAAAIVEKAVEEDVEHIEATAFVSLRGFGVQATIGGQQFTAASPRYFREQQGRWNTRSVLTGGEDDCESSQVVIGSEGRLLGIISLRDILRDDAPEAVRQWRELGVRHLTILTGDRKSVADRVARELKIDDVHADLLPEDKIRWVRQMVSREPDLMMVGDGVNDAPALAAASIGVAMGCTASDLALETSDVVIMSPRLEKISTLILLSRRTRSILRQNIAFALVVKLVVLGLAAAGHATLWLAVGADVGASLLVILNGTRLLNSSGPLAKDSL